MTIPIREEKVDIEKRPVEVEEIRVSKVEEVEQEPVSTTVRREIAEVDTRGSVEQETSIVDKPGARKTGTTG